MAQVGKRQRKGRRRGRAEPVRLIDPSEIRKLPGPPSLLSGILDALGDDLLCAVFELLEPYDLHALARTCRRTAKCILGTNPWLFDRALERLALGGHSPPAPPSWLNVSIAQWCAILWPASCVFCFRERDPHYTEFPRFGDHTRILGLGQTCCERCLHDRFVWQITRPDCQTYGQYPETVEKLYPTLDPRVTGCVDRVVRFISTYQRPGPTDRVAIFGYLKTDLERTAAILARICEEAGDNVEIADAIIAAKIEEQSQRNRKMDECKAALKAWDMRERSRLSKELETRRVRNRDLLYNELDRRMAELGFEAPVLARLRTGDQGYGSLLYHARLGLAPRDTSSWFYYEWRDLDLSLHDLNAPSGWTRIKSRLIARAHREQAIIAAELAKSELEKAEHIMAWLYPQLRQAMQQGSILPGLLPSPRALFAQAVFRHLFVDVNGRLRTPAGPPAPLPLLQHLVRAWRVAVVTDLARMVVPSVDVQAVPGPTAVLARPDAVYRCRRCKEVGRDGGFTWEAALAHPCLNAEVTFPLPALGDWADELPSRWLDAVPCEAIARAVLQACGINEARQAPPTAAFLLNIADRKQIPRELRMRISTQAHSFADLLVRLAAIGDEALAVEVAAGTRFGRRIPRKPLTVNMAQPDWVEGEGMPSPRAVSPFTSGDEGDPNDRRTRDRRERKRRYADRQRHPPAEPPALVSAANPQLARFDDTAQAFTVFGCSLCSSLLPTTEAEAWLHVMRRHDKISEPTDASIFAVRLPRPVS